MGLASENPPALPQPSIKIGATGQMEGASMLSQTLPAHCVPPLPPPADTWYVLGILWAPLLFAAALALLMILRGWRAFAGVPLLAGIWCLLLAFWVQEHPRTFTENRAGKLR